MKAVVMGATGLVGSELVATLLNDKDVESIIVLTRRSTFTHPKVKEVLISSLEELPKLSNEIKGDIYFCALGTTIKTAKTKENFRKVDQEAVIAFAKIAKLHEAKSFSVISAHGANAHSPFFYNKVKGEVEEELKELGLKRLVIFRPGLLVGDRKERRTLEAKLIGLFRGVEGFLPTKFAKSIATDVPRLAQQMVASSKSSRSQIEIIDSQEI